MGTFLNKKATIKNNHLGYRSGAYYSSHPYMGSAQNSSTAQTAGSISYIPIQIFEPCNIAIFALNCVGAIAGSKVRLGLYNTSKGIPTNLIVDGGEQDCSTTGYKLFTAPVTLLQGWYWGAVIINSGAPSFTASSSVYGNTCLIGGASPTGSSGVTALRSSPVTYGAMPLVAPIDASPILLYSASTVIWYVIQ